MTKVFNQGFAGCVHLHSDKKDRKCDIKVIILLYNNKDSNYLGYIPNEQTQFVDCIREVIKKQKTAQQAASTGAQGSSQEIQGQNPGMMQANPQGQIMTSSQFANTMQTGGTVSMTQPNAPPRMPGGMNMGGPMMSAAGNQGMQQRMQMQQQMSQMNPGMQQRMQIRPGNVNVQGGLRQILQQQQGQPQFQQMSMQQQQQMGGQQPRGPFQGQ